MLRHLGPALVMALLADVAPALAQPVAPPRTPGSVFGGETGRKARETVDVSASLVYAHDSDTPAEFQGVIGSDVLGGRSTLFNAGAEYKWEGSRVQVGATGASVLRHYSEIDDGTISGSAGLGVSARLGSRTALSANQSLAYAPSYLYGLFPSTQSDTPGQPTTPAPATDYALDDTASYNYGTTVSLTHGLSRRSRVSASGEYHVTDFLRETQGRRDLNVGTARGDFGTNVTRHVEIRAGYHYRTGSFAYAGALASGADASSTEHGLDLGVEYSRPVSASRRMVFAFEFGPATTTIPVTTISGTTTSALTTTDERVLRYTSDGSVTWEFSRSWNTRIAARRSLEYIAQLAEPVFVDGVSAEVGGVLSSRLDVQGALRYSNGASASTAGALKFDTYSAETLARYGLSRSLALYVQYVYYFYDFQQKTALPGGLPPSLERNGIRVGVTVWASPLRR